MCIFSLLPFNSPCAPKKKQKKKKKRIAGRKKHFRGKLNTCNFLCFRWSSFLSKWSSRKMILRSVVYLGKMGVCVHVHFCSWSQKCLWNLPIQCQNISSLSSGTSPVVCSYVLIVWMDTARAKNNGYKDFGRGTQCPFIGQSWSNWVLADSAKPNWNIEGAFLLTENSQIFFITWKFFFLKWPINIAKARSKDGRILFWFDG